MWCDVLWYGQEFVETDAEKAAAAVGTGKAAPGKKARKKKGAGRSGDEVSVCVLC